MDDFKIHKCPSCGSSLVETDSESIIVCSHCGSQLVSENKGLSQIKIDNSLIKKLLFVVISLIVAIGGVVLWFSVDEKSIPQESNKMVQINTTNKLINTPVSSIPKLNTKNNGMTKQTIEKNKNSIEKPTITIISNVESDTSIGGKYWIVTIRNDSNTEVVRPRVIMSLFDGNKRRIDEHVGWSKQDTLAKGAETTVLVLVSKPPQSPYTSEIQAMATLPSQFITGIETITVDDFIVNVEAGNPKKATIVGDVSNQNGFQVDFIWVQAIARNKEGIAVGLADAYVTNSSLAPQENSGFKIKAGTFIAQAPATWSLWASGRKHRDN